MRFLILWNMLGNWEHEIDCFDRLLRTAPEDKFEIVKTWCSPLPALAIVQNSYDGVVLSGSPADAYAQEPWIVALGNWVAAYAANIDEMPPLLGVCFGHQITSHYLGGLAGPNRFADPPGRFYLGVCNVSVSIEILKEMPWYDPSLDEPIKQYCGTCSRDVLPRELALGISKSHGDASNKLPPCAVLLGCSEQSGHEIYAIGSRILTFQGHPELDPHRLTDHVLPILRDRGRIPEEQVPVIEKSLETPVAVDFWKQLLHKFFEYGKAHRKCPKNEAISS